MDVTPAEQLLLEFLNRARANPPLEAARYGIKLNEGMFFTGIEVIPPTPCQPLAFNPSMQTAAAGHADYLASTGLLVHNSADGTNPTGRAAANGYLSGSLNENLASQPTPATPAAIENLHRSIFLDAGTPFRDRRIGLFISKFKDTGIAVRTGQTPAGPGVVAVETLAYKPSDATVYLTGVVHNDPSGFYSMGSGVAGVEVKAGSLSTTTFASGGYTLALPAGTHTVTFTQGGTVLQTSSVTIADRNVKLDCVIGVAPPSPSGLADGGFETPDVGAGQFRYFPTGSPWAFEVSAGLASNGSGFTSGNAGAPSGTQVAFLQCTGAVSQTFTTAAGKYAVAFKGATRGNMSQGGQALKVTIDGVVVSPRIDMTSLTYTQFKTPDVTLTAGPHTLRIEGLNPNGGDNTAFLDDVEIVAG